MRRSRSRSPQRHRNYDEHPHGGGGGMVVEVITQITARMIGAGGLEAGALEEGEDEAGVLEEKETGVQLGKAVLREGQKLSNGIGKKNRQNLVTKMLTVSIRMAAIVMAMQKMEHNTMTLISSRSPYQMMEFTTTDSSGFIWFRYSCFQDQASFLLQLTVIFVLRVERCLQKYTGFDLIHAQSNCT